MGINDLLKGAGYYLGKAVRPLALGISLALTPTLGCGPPERDLAAPPGEDESSEVASDLEVIIASAVTDENGIARFDRGEPITVKDAEETHLAGIEVKLYRVHEDGSHQGDVYLAGNAEVGGGMAAFTREANQRAGTRRHGTGGGRELTIRPREGLTTFDRRSQEMVYNLQRWIMRDEYRCEGVFTTEELIAQRERVGGIFSLTSHYDPSGVSQGVNFTYDAISYLIDRGVLEDMPADKEWYILSPDNPLAPPLTIQADLAREVYGSRTNERLEEACLKGSEDAEEKMCIQYLEDFFEEGIDRDVWVKPFCGSCETSGGMVTSQDFNALIASPLFCCSDNQIRIAANYSAPTSLKDDEEPNKFFSLSVRGPMVVAGEHRQPVKVRGSPNYFRLHAMHFARNVVSPYLTCGDEQIISGPNIEAEVRAWNRMEIIIDRGRFHIYTNDELIFSEDFCPKALIDDVGISMLLGDDWGNTPLRMSLAYIGVSCDINRD